jgi:hypothetical protein
MKTAIPGQVAWNMTDYKQLEPTHHLSAYEIRLPLWRPIKPYDGRFSVPSLFADEDTRYSPSTPLLPPH